AGFLLNGDDDAEEVCLRDRNAFIELAASFADRHADRLCLDDGAKFRLHWLVGFDSDHLQAIEQWEAGPYAAHDDVDSVHKGMEEFRFAALLQVREQPAWNTEGAGEGSAKRRQQAEAGEEYDDEKHEADRAGNQHELLFRPGQAGEPDTLVDRQFGLP